MGREGGEGQALASLHFKAERLQNGEGGAGRKRGSSIQQIIKATFHKRQRAAQLLAHEDVIVSNMAANGVTNNIVNINKSTCSRSVDRDGAGMFGEFMNTNKKCHVCLLPAPLAPAYSPSH